MAEASKDSAKMDVDKAAPADKDKDKEKEKEKAPVDPNKLTIADINASLTLIRRGVASQEDRFMVRVVRLVPRLRKRLNANVLHAVIQKHFVGADAQKAALLAYLPAPTEPVETQAAAAPAAAATTGAAAPAAPAPILPEAEIYIHTLVVIFLIDSEKHAEAVECAERLIARAVETKRRSSDVLCARAYFYFARAHELNNSMSAIRSTLHAALRAASIRCDEPGQATLINLLLHNYLSENLVEQADVLVSKAPFPESATNNDAARYLFYLGRIRAIQLDYSEAHRHLVQAIRKAPKSAVGFLQTVNKLAVIVQLLLGEIPERDLFRHTDLQRSLAPYFKLTQAVRVGDLGRFNDVIQTFGDRFQADKTYKLILRLRHNVIKTGVRMISLSYSRISFADISAKLQLGSADDAEYIVAKAIRDGVIDATINHEEGCVRSKEVVDIYSTNEPQDAFHQRIAFCLKLHNDSVKAMRYSRNAYRKYLETPEQRREREMQEEEIARDMDDKDD